MAHGRCHALRCARGCTAGKQLVFTTNGMRFCSPFSVPALDASLPGVGDWQRRHGFAVEASKDGYKLIIKH